MEEQILAFVELMGGRGNEELLRPLCQAAEREMAGRLREGLSPEACGPAFPVAAAWLVLAGLEAGTDGVTWPIPRSGPGCPRCLGRRSHRPAADG